MIELQEMYSSCCHETRSLRDRLATDVSFKFHMISLVYLFVLLTPSLYPVFLAQLHLSRKLIKAKQPAEFRVSQPRGRNVRYLYHGGKKRTRLAGSALTRVGEIGGRYRRGKTLPSFFLFARIPRRTRHSS